MKLNLINIIVEIAKLREENTEIPELKEKLLSMRVTLACFVNPNIYRSLFSILSF